MSSNDSFKMVKTMMSSVLGNDLIDLKNKAERAKKRET